MSSQLNVSSDWAPGGEASGSPSETAETEASRAREDRAPERRVVPFRGAQGRARPAQREDRRSQPAIPRRRRPGLATHRARFRHVSMLTGSRFIQLTADFVRRFADLGDTMRLYTDPAAFEGALSASIASAPPE